ncbi:putative Ca2+/H+ antiporter (TMEM165/GDT1 family) [Blastomonas natatoria]|uniref:GDT1 family protein n=1 Tax=Blastomonas natatoria TaxID=34015 RepID=A0A2V3UUG2_9SPHN|nr:TMEM165/GDT1 family protein [Blastomonas natatoria]PXW72952.1 putative Ca2+/H+ antiporter (TMEM165/GDT1 family) [Blastomonas natatoria]
MEAFFTTFLLTAITQAGDRAQLLCAALGQRFDRPVPLSIGVILASGAMAAIGALGGVAVGTWISLDALRLFYALSLLFAGLGMLAPRRAVDTLPGWRTGPVLTGLLGLFILQFGDKGQFIIAATAARNHDWVWPLVGGWAGMVVGLVPAIVWQAKLADWPIRSVRLGAGVVITLIGAALALGAFGLV